MTVRYTCRVPPTGPSAVLGRTAYRFVQEGLTNARKHAPDGTVEVLLDGTAGEDLRITITNPYPGAPERAVPGAGMGLVGLGERVALAVIRQLIDHIATPAAGPRRSQARASLARLTDREREVAVALGRGLPNAQISAELGMSIPTVEGHVSRLLTKLELNNRVQVALLIHDAELPP